MEVNINKIRDYIKEEVTMKAVERFGVTKDEVKVSFDKSGDIKVTIVPESFIKSLSVSVLVNNGGNENAED